MRFENKGKFNIKENDLINEKKDSLQKFLKRRNEQIKNGVKTGEFRQLSQKQVEKITQNIPRESSILEIGSHDGLLLEQLRDSEKDYKLTGSDIRNDSLEAIEKRVPEAAVISFNIIEDKFEDKFKDRFDVIFMKLVLGPLPLKKAELALNNEDRLLSLQEQEEIWDKALEKIKNSCKQFVLITPVPKEGINAENIRPIFVPDDVLQRLLDKHFKSKELLEIQKTDKEEVFDLEIYLLSEPKID